MLLSQDELTTVYYKQAAGMDSNDVFTYLARANAFCVGSIGGIPGVIDETIKTAVALAFEIFAQGETAQVDINTGNITEAAPAGYYSRKASDPMQVVREMLGPAKAAYTAGNVATSDRGVSFL